MSWVLLAGVGPAQPASPTERAASSGERAAVALRAALDGTNSAAAYRTLQSERDAMARGGGAVDRVDQVPNDPYLPWLEAELLRRAADGKLFVAHEQAIQLRLTWDMGDDHYWYLCVVRKGGVARDDAQRLGPWLAWKSLGAMVTPDGPEDKPWITDYELEGVAAGDLAEVEVYRAPRDARQTYTSINPRSLLDKGEAVSVLRVQVPVVVTK